MRAVRHSIITLLIGAGILLLGNGLQITLLPIRADLEAFSAAWIGVMGAANFTGFAAGCLLGPVFLRKVGHIRAFAGFGAMAAGIGLGFALLVDPLAWCLLRAATGLCMAVLYMVIESWLNDLASNEVRGRVLSLYIIVTNLVTMGGQLMVNLYDPAGQALFMLVAMLIAFSLVPLALTNAAAPKPISEARLRIAALYRVSPAGFVGCLVVGMVEGAFWTMGPVFAQQRDFPIAEVTFFMSLFLAGGTLSQWPLGRLSDHMDRRFVIVGCCLGTVCTGLAITFLPLTLLQSFALAALHGAFMLPLYALLLAHANDHTPNDKLVETSGGLLLVYALGAILGPLVLGPAMQFFGPGALFLGIVVLLGLLALFILLRFLLRPVPGDEAERVEFWPVPKTTQSVYALEESDEESKSS